MAVSASEQRTLANLARAANRRIERASPGQREYLTLYVQKYHSRKRADGTIVFQQGKAQSRTEYNARIKELKLFMEAKSSTRKGWEAQKKAQIASAGETLRGEGADITDEELAQILQEIGTGHSSLEFYKALANVEIAKAEQGDTWNASEDEIRNAIAERRDAQQRALTLIKAREARKNASAEIPR